MRISIGEQTQDAMKVLGIENYPFSPEELSTKFRSLVKRHHPDTNKNDPAAKDTTQKLIIAYRHLKNLAVAMFVDEEQEREAERIFEKDEDIFNIWDTCPECGGSGTIRNEWGFGMTKPCPDCDPMESNFFSGLYSYLERRSSGFKTLKCKYCKGTGKFKLRNGKIVDCQKCYGTGNWKRVKCRTCNGSGVVSEEVDEFITCPHCNGLGIIKVTPFNPVIRKGAVLHT